MVSKLYQVENSKIQKTSFQEQLKKIVALAKLLPSIIIIFINKSNTLNSATKWLISYLAQNKKARKMQAKVIIAPNHKLKALNLSKKRKKVKPRTLNLNLSPLNLRPNLNLKQKLKLKKWLNQQLPPQPKSLKAKKNHLGVIHMMKINPKRSLKKLMILMFLINKSLLLLHHKLKLLKNQKLLMMHLKILIQLPQIKEQQTLTNKKVGLNLMILLLLNQTIKAKKLNRKMIKWRRANKRMIRMLWVLAKNYQNKNLLAKLNKMILLPQLQNLIQLNLNKNLNHNFQLEMIIRKQAVVQQQH